MVRNIFLLTAERVEILISTCCTRVLVRNPDPAAANSMQQAVDSISIFVTEGAFAKGVHQRLALIEGHVSGVADLIEKFSDSTVRFEGQSLHGISLNSTILI